MKVLFLSRWFPYPADNGARIRVLNLIKQLASRHQVSLASFHDGSTGAPHLAAMREWCDSVSVARFQDFRPGRVKAVLGYASPLPRSVVDTHSAEMQQLVLAEAARVQPDLIVASALGMAPYALLVKGPIRVLEEIELGLMQHQVEHAPSTIKRLRGQLTWSKFTRYVASLLADFDGFTVVSERELKMVSQLGADIDPRRACVVPNGIDVRLYQDDHGVPQPGTLIYSGALTYHANFDAVSYFLRDIYPLIKASQPTATLSVTGKLDGVSLDALAHDASVQFTGYLEDVRPRIAQSWAGVVPLRIGGGTRLKILESLALGTPVITTSKGVEGLNLSDGEQVLVADNPHAFADATIRLLTDPELRARLAGYGRQTVAAHYDWASLGRTFCDFVEGLTHARSAAREVEGMR